MASKVTMIVLSVLVITVMVSCVQGQSNQGYYDSRYDYLDVDAILDNRRLVKQYVECLVGQRPCSPEGKALKQILPEGLRTKCARCTPKQKYLAVKVIQRLRNEYKDEWRRLTVKWDPTGDFTRRFEDLLNSDDDHNRIDTPVENMSTSTMRVLLLNRFGDEENSGSASEAVPSIKPSASTIRPVMSTNVNPTTSRPMMTTGRPVMTTRRPVIITQSTTNRAPTAPPTITMAPSVYHISTMRPPVTMRTTQRPRKKVHTTIRPMDPLVLGTMGIIDHFGNKIIKTTELVTGILKDTVRIVAGPRPLYQL